MNGAAEAATPSTTSVQTCELPAAWPDRRGLLDVGAVVCEATDWSNRQRPGSHNGGFAHVTFDLGGALAGIPSREVKP